MREMSSDAHLELFKLLIDTADETPLPILADCLSVLSAVLAKRLHDEVDELEAMPPAVPMT